MVYSTPYFSLAQHRAMAMASATSAGSGGSAQIQHRLNRPLHLTLGRPAIAGQRLFDPRGRIFGNLGPRLRRHFFAKSHRGHGPSKSPSAGACNEHTTARPPPLPAYTFSAPTGYHRQSESSRPASVLSVAMRNTPASSSLTSSNFAGLDHRIAAHPQPRINSQYLHILNRVLLP